MTDTTIITVVCDPPVTVCPEVQQRRLLVGLDAVDVLVAVGRADGLSKFSV